MVVLTDSDGGAALTILRKNYKYLSTKRSASNLYDKVLEAVNDVIQRPQLYSVGTRKLALQFNFSLQGTRPSDWLSCAAALDSSDVTVLDKAARVWAKCSKAVTGNSDEEYMFLSGLIQRIVKFKKELAELWDTEMLSTVRQKMLITSITLTETRSEDSSHLIKAIVKMYSTEQERQTLFELCLTQMPFDMDGPLLLMSILLSNNLTLREDSIDTLISLMPRWAENQTVANSSAPLVCALIERFSANAGLQSILLLCLTSRKSSVRSNTARCWLGRAVGQKQSLPLFDFLLESLRSRWNDVIRSSDDHCWPPRMWETEDISCIDPQWQWLEAEDVFWMRDRIVAGYLTVWQIISIKYSSCRRPAVDDPIILSALQWHLPDIRLSALQLVRNTDGMQSVMEQFLLENIDCDSEEVVAEVRALSRQTPFCDHQLIQQAISSRKSDESHEGSSGVYVPADLPQQSAATCPAPEIPSRLASLLALSGCTDSVTCPSFPVVYANLDAAGVNHRAFAKEITDLMSQLVATSDPTIPTERVFDCLWNTVTSCRMKAVVDKGCTLFEDLLGSYSDQLTVSRLYFDKAVISLVTSSSTARTLAVSRVLWSCCSCRVDLLSEFWHRVAPLLMAETDPTVLARILKTLKMFVSKSSCHLPAGATETMFWFCLEAQLFSDFLVRSAATILFGFLGKSITGGLARPLFYLTVNYRELWQEIVRRCRSICALSRPQRVLLLTFLADFSISNEMFYSDEELSSLDSFRSQLCLILSSSPCVRERRFCIDVLLQMTCRSEWQSLLEESQVEPSAGASSNQQADRCYLTSQLKRLLALDGSPSSSTETSAAALPADLRVSPYVQLIEQVASLVNTTEENSFESRIEDVQRRIDEMCNLSYELGAQTAAMTLVQLTRAIGEIDSRISPSSSLRQLLFSHCLRLLHSPFPRARSLISRVPVYLGLSNTFLHRNCAERKLREWASLQE